MAGVKKYIKIAYTDCMNTIMLECIVIHRLNSFGCKSWLKWQRRPVVRLGISQLFRQGGPNSASGTNTAAFAIDTGDASVITPPLYPHPLSWRCS